MSRRYVSGAFLRVYGNQAAPAATVLTKIFSFIKPVKGKKKKTRDPGFQKLDSRFQRSVFRFPRAKISWIPESGSPYMGRTEVPRAVPYNVLKS